jgi:predicted regulator of amino acid metabolism with ACT domain
MHLSRRPQPAPTPIRIEPADVAAIDVAVALTAEAHHVDREMVENTIRHAGLSGTARVWIAWDGVEPVSVIWIGRRHRRLGVMEIMTPERHQIARDRHVAIIRRHTPPPVMQHSRTLAHATRRPLG